MQAVDQIYTYLSSELDTWGCIAPWIDFDDYKIFEGVTNDFGLEKDLLYFRSKIIILLSSDSKVSRARIEDLWSIGGNFTYFGCIFWEKIKFKKKIDT